MLQCFHLLDGDIIVKWFKFINRKLNGYSERVRAVDVDNFNNLAEDGTKYSISDDEAIAVVKEWYDDVGEDGVLRVKKIINEVFEKHLLGEEGIYQRQKVEVAEMLVNLAKTANTIEAPQARGFIKIIAQLANIVERGCCPRTISSFSFRNISPCLSKYLFSFLKCSSFSPRSTILASWAIFL